MIVHFYHDDENPWASRLEMRGDNADEILRIKRLPGRFYNPDKDIWIVPMTIGLAIALEDSEAFLDVALLALIQEQEKTLLYSLTAPADHLTPGELEKITADQAIREAFAHHYLTDHKGQDADYLAVHREALNAPEVKPSKRRRKTEREVKDRQIREGRID